MTLLIQCSRSSLKHGQSNKAVDRLRSPRARALQLPGSSTATSWCRAWCRRRVCAGSLGGAWARRGHLETRLLGMIGVFQWNPMIHGFAAIVFGYGSKLPMKHQWTVEKLFDVESIWCECILTHTHLSASWCWHDSWLHYLILLIARSFDKTGHSLLQQILALYPHYEGTRWKESYKRFKLNLYFFIWFRSKDSSSRCSLMICHHYLVNELFWSVGCLPCYHAAWACHRRF